MAMGELKIGRRTMIVGVFRVYVDEDFDTTMFIDSGNPYGYGLNIAHHKIGKWYKQFKKKNNLPSVFPISDEERFEFEIGVYRKLGISFDNLNAEEVKRVQKGTVDYRPRQPSTVRG